MDPDMVRQQAEAEREALALLHAKPARPAPPKAEPVLRAIEAQDAVRNPREATGQTGAGLEVSPYSRAPRMEAAAGPVAIDAHALPAQPQPAPRHSVAGKIGRSISFGLAGAMLGGGLGIAGANYFELPAELAKLAIYGPAGFFAAVCAIASFFAKAPDQ